MEKERLIASGGGGSRGTLGRLQPTTNGSFISAPVCRMLMCVCVFLSARYSVRVCGRKKEIEREKKVKLRPLLFTLISLDNRKQLISPSPLLLT